MTSSEQKAENISKLLEQHWLHCRHLETERALFMSIYGAVVGGILAFMAKGLDISQNSNIFIALALFLIGLTTVGFFHTLRWIHSFEYHRSKVNELINILWSMSKVNAMLDPSMDIPSIRMTPRYIKGWQIPECFSKVDDFFRTRYWFPLLYFVVLIGITWLLFVIETHTCIKWISLGVLIFAFWLGFSWYTSLNKSTKIVVLEGCNGEWAQQSYLPFLVNQAKEGLIQLWAVDVEPKIKLTSLEVTAAWREASKKGNACYQNKKTNIESYEVPDNIDFVFIVTPDEYHCRLAEYWFERLNKKGKIFIEKPLDVSIKAAEAIKNKKDVAKTVYGFDHYLARAYLLSKKNLLKKQKDIGSIEFNILEKDPIPPEKKKTLKKGVIFDLLPHVLAIVSTTSSGYTNPSKEILDTVKYNQILPAEYENPPISGETFARVQFTIDINKNKIKVDSAVGKGAGKSDVKNIKFNKEAPTNLDQDENLKLKPVESFLKAIVLGKNPLSAPGVLSFDAALAILEKLEEAKKQAQKRRRRYKIGTPADKIE